MKRKRHEDTLARRRPAGSYAPRPNRFGIQNWRMASTTVGMSRHASRPKDGVLRPKFAFSEVRHLLEMLRDIPSMAFLATGHKCLQFFEVNHKLRDLGTLASP